MEYFPLVPKGDHDENHCIIHILRESFQNALHRQPFPENIAENAAKFRMDDEMLKEEAETVNAIFNDKQQSSEAFEILENEIMTNQGTFMINNEAVEKDDVLKETLKLKRVEVFKNVKADQAREYTLVLKTDLLPSKPEQYIDFRINTSKHWCLTKCTEGIRPDLDFIPTKLDKSRLPLSPLKRFTTHKAKTAKKELTTQAKTNLIFKPYPKIIKFTNYVPNQTYEKTIKLKNTSKKTQTVVLKTLPKNQIFTIQAISKISKVAAGMTVHYKVLFRTSTYKDAEDLVSFITYGGQTIEIKLMCMRQPPALQAFVCKDVDNLLCKVEANSSSGKFFDDSRASALNFTFDCGQCLLGERSRMSLLIRNEGGSGVFFIMTEDDWYFGDVENSDMNFELYFDGFEIRPSYFTIAKEEFVELQVTFRPLHFGLHAERCYLLCNNTGYEEFDIVGDGMYFEKDFVECQVGRKQETLSYFDRESEFYIYLGACLPQTKRSCLIPVSNHSHLNLSYRWEIRKSVTHNKITKLKRMNDSWLNIINPKGVLCGNTVTNFEIIVNAGSYLSGLYSIVVGLYIVDIPEASLAENTDFVVVNRMKKSDDPLKSETLDVLIGEIEIACDIVTTNVLLVPPQMIFPLELEYKEVVIKEVTITTKEEFSLQCKWKVFNKRNGQTCCVKMKPGEFVLQPNEPLTCELIVCAHTYDNIQEKLMLFVNDGLLTKEYYVLAKVAPPKIEVSTHVLDFGYVAIEQPLSKKLYLKNLCNSSVHWELYEFTYDFNEKKLVEVPTRNVSIYAGVLKRYGDTVEITYKINAKEVYQWFSFLMVLITHPLQTIQKTPILITYEVCQPNIIIHTPTSTSPILCINELLNLSVITHAVVCMHNTSNVPAYFLWGSAVGKHKHCVNLRFNPKAGLIKPRNTFKVTVSLKPLVTGILEHIYVPCFVGRMAEPVILTVMCAVDNIHVCFALPIDDQKYRKILWPPKIVDEFNFPTYVPLYLHGEESLDSFVIDVPDVDTKYCFQELLNSKPATVKQVIDSPKVAENFEFPKVLSLDYQGEETPPSSPQSDQSVVVEKPRLADVFGSELILEDYHLEIRQVPLRTPIRKKIFMRNLTPMSSSFTAEVTNFEGLDIKPTSMEELLEQAGLQKCDNWDRTIYPGNGIVVKITPACKRFHSRQVILIDLYIYANTWGIYVEEVVIEIKDIPPFCFSMIIEVVGSPIEYPFALNTLQELPTLRLGDIPLGCIEPIKRHLKVKNVSSIPISLFWHVFLTPDPSENDHKQNFNLIYYMKDINQIEFRKSIQRAEEIKLLLTEYHGNETTSDVFQIQPIQLDMFPHTTYTISITFHPKEFRKKYKTNRIEATLVGYIDIADEYSFRPNYFSRAVATELGPTKLQISGTISSPILQIEHVKGDLRVIAYASEIVQNGGFSATQRLVFRNISTAVAVIEMFINRPFAVVSMQTCGMRGASVVALQPDACVEVFVECAMVMRDLEEFAGALYQRGSVKGAKAIADNSTVVIKRNLNIKLKGVAILVTPLELVIYYPVIEVKPMILNFGNVWIGNSCKASFTIYNCCEHPINFSLQLENAAARNVFILSVNEGVVPGPTGSRKGEKIIDVCFVPNESQWYNETLKVVTSITTYYKEVNLIANGTINQKFYKVDD